MVDILVSQLWLRDRMRCGENPACAGQALEAGLIYPKNGGKHFNQRRQWVEPLNLG